MSKKKREYILHNIINICDINLLFRERMKHPLNDQ